LGIAFFSLLLQEFEGGGSYLTAVAAPKRDLEELKREFAERALRGEELTFRLLEPAVKALALGRVLEGVEKRQIELLSRVPPVYFEIELDIRDIGNVTLDANGNLNVEVYAYGDDDEGGSELWGLNLTEASVSDVLRLLEIDRETGILGKLKEALEELAERAERGILEWRKGTWYGGREGFEAKFTTSDGGKVHVFVKRPEDIGALAESLPEFVAVLNLLSIASQQAWKLYDEMGLLERARKVLADEVEGALGLLYEFYDSVDWDSTGENVVRRAGELAEEVFKEGWVRGEALAEIAGEKAGELLSRLSSRVVESIGGFELKGVIPELEESASAGSIVAHLAGLAPPPFEEAGERSAVKVKVSHRRNAGFGLTLQDRQTNRFLPLPLIRFRGNATAFDVEGLIALSYLEDRYGFVSKLVEEMESREEVFFDRLARDVALAATAYPYLTLLFGAVYPGELEDLVRRVLGGQGKPF
jgi:hypothetical protein